MRYLHTMIRASDLDKTLEFFVNHLGLVEMRRYDSEQGRFTLVFLAAPDDVDRAEVAQSPLVEITYNWDPEDYDGVDKFTGEPQAGVPRKLNLNHLTFHLPFDKVEYEPEQFPGLIYRLDDPKVVCLIFGSGKMVITGARHKDEILEAVEIIKDELADLL